MSTPRLLLRGSLLSGLDQLVRALAALVLAPLVVAKLGVADFGAWVLLSGVFSQFVLLDPGLRSSLTRFLSAADARADRTELRQIASTAFVVYGLIALAAALLTGVVWIGLPWVVGNDHLLADCRVVTVALGGATCASFATRVFVDFLQSRLRGDVIAASSMGRVLVCNAVIVWLLLARGQGLAALSLVHGAGGVAEALGMLWWGRALLPHIRLRWAGTPMARTLIGFSAWSYLITTSERLRSGLDGFILGWLRGSPAAGVYSLGLRPAAMAFDTIYAFIGTQLLPVFSRLRETSDHAVLCRVFLVMVRIATQLAAIGSAVLLIVGPLFLHWWVPSHAREAIPVLICLALPFGLQTSQMPATHLLFSLAEHRALAWAQVMAVMLNLLLSWLLASWLGLIGAALGTAAEILLLHGLIMPWLMHRKAGVLWRDFMWRAQLRPLLSVLLVVTPAALLVHFLAPAQPSLGELLAVAASLGLWLAVGLFWGLPVRADWRELKALTQRQWRGLA